MGFMGSFPNQSSLHFALVWMALGTRGEICFNFLMGIPSKMPVPDHFCVFALRCILDEIELLLRRFHLKNIRCIGFRSRPTFIEF